MKKLGKIILRIFIGLIIGLAILSIGVAALAILLPLGIVLAPIMAFLLFLHDLGKEIIK